MREEPLLDERLTDWALLLALWHDSAQRPLEDAGDKLRQMKLAFLVAHPLFEQKVKGLNCSFYRWTWGPMSNQVYDAWNALSAAGLMESEEHFVISRRGADLAQAFTAEVLKDEANTPVREVLTAVSETWKPKQSTRAILTHVYSMQVTPLDALSPKATLVRDLPEGRQITRIVDEDEAASSLIVPNAWLETLAMLFSPSAISSLQTAEDDFREKRFRVA
jgi:hypothetical protein